MIRDETCHWRTNRFAFGACHHRRSHRVLAGKHSRWHVPSDNIRGVTRMRAVLVVLDRNSAYISFRIPHPGHGRSGGRREPGAAAQRDPAASSRRSPQGGRPRSDLHREVSVPVGGRRCSRERSHGRTGHEVAGARTGQGRSEQGAGYEGCCVESRGEVCFSADMEYVFPSVIQRGSHYDISPFSLVCFRPTMCIVSDLSALASC